MAVRTWHAPNTPAPLTATLAERARSGTRPTTRPETKPAPKPKTPPQPKPTSAAPAPAKPTPGDHRLPDDPALLRAWAAGRKRVSVTLRGGEVLHGRLLEVARYAVLLLEVDETAPSVVMKHALDTIRLVAD